jgi:hypothetical protein
MTAADPRPHLGHQSVIGGKVRVRGVGEVGKEREGVDRTRWRNGVCTSGATNALPGEGHFGLYEEEDVVACGVEPAWDRESFFQSATMQYVLPDRTLFDGVRQLQPGHYLLGTDGGVKRRGKA